MFSIFGTLFSRVARAGAFVALLLSTSSFAAIANLSILNQQQILLHVNDYRASHGSQAVTWNGDIESSCEKWATTLASINALQHSSTSYGENLFQLYAPTQTGSVDLIKTGVDIWYAEIANYNFSNPGFSPNTGHLTSILWANTRQIGAGIDFSGTNAIIVMQFFPPGNFFGQFADNVRPLAPAPVPLIVPQSPPSRQSPQSQQSPQPPIPIDLMPQSNQSSYISIKYSFMYDTEHDYSTITTLSNNLCPALIFALPFNATTVCQRQYASTTGTYYGMGYSEEDLNLIKDYIILNVRAFTISAQLFCGSTVALFVGKNVIYRLEALSSVCFH